MGYQNAVESWNVEVAEVSQDSGYESLKSTTNSISLLKNDDLFGCLFLAKPSISFASFTGCEAHSIEIERRSHSAACILLNAVKKVFRKKNLGDPNVHLYNQDILNIKELIGFTHLYMFD